MANPTRNPEPAPRKETWWEYFLVLPTLGIFAAVFYISRPNKPTYTPDAFGFNPNGVYAPDSAFEPIESAEEAEASAGVPKPLNLALVSWEIEYPEAAEEKGITGVVEVQVTVNGQGVYESHTILSSPDPMLADAVSKAIVDILYEMPSGWDERKPFTDILEFEVGPE